MSDERGGVDADRHAKTLDSARIQGEDTWALEERERRQREADAAAVVEARRQRAVGLIAAASAEMAQARSEAMSSAATVGIGGLSGLMLLGGPVGAVAGIASGWLLDKLFNERGVL